MSDNVGREGSIRHPELSLVKLARPIDSDDGPLPAGAAGAVMHVYPGEIGYDIEFYEPFHAVATVEADAIAE